MMTTPRILGAAVAAFAVLSVASPVLAHIDPDPTDAQAGSEVSVGFTVEHGCEGSPTERLDMRLPDGVTAPVAEPPSGWTGQIEDNIVSFIGGPLPDDEELTFRVRMILPPTPDATIYFPFVQRCEIGEIRWIDLPRDDSDTELDEPAPAMQLFGPVATAQPTPTTSAPSTTAPPAPSTTDSATTSTTVSPTTVPEIDTTPSVPASTDSGEVDDGGSLGSLFFVLSIAAVAVMGTLAIRQARRGRSRT
jgi:uncharacterized protein YcnI